MYVLVLACFVLGKGLSVKYSSLEKYDFHFKPENSIRTIKEINLNDSFFSSLENYHVNAELVSEQDYPWIARVIHSRTKNFPHVCTAVCIDPAIFITAARCIYTLRVNYTSIIYRRIRLLVLAFVLPTKMSKQGYDDIGFIIVKNRNIKRWAVIELFNNINRTDDVFRWFANLDFTYGNINTKVVGFAAEKNQQLSWEAERQFFLTTLNVFIGLDICPNMLTDPEKFKAFFVPCYYPCSFTQYLKGEEVCQKYHGVEGGAIYDTLSKKLLGVATWGSYSSRMELPVGFSFANSVNFFKDYNCAKRIRNDNELLITKGYYQSLCSII